MAARSRVLARTRVPALGIRRYAATCSYFLRIAFHFGWRRSDRQHAGHVRLPDGANEPAVRPARGFPAAPSHPLTVRTDARFSNSGFEEAHSAAVELYFGQVVPLIRYGFHDYETRVPPSAYRPHRSRRHLAPTHCSISGRPAQRPRLGVGRCAHEGDPRTIRSPQRGPITRGVSRQRVRRDRSEDANALRDSLNHRQFGPRAIVPFACEHEGRAVGRPARISEFPEMSHDELYCPATACHEESGV